MNKNSPKVSIILPTYNGARYIRQSIDSCLNQIYRNIELIIVDDGSTDETAELIKSYKDDRIKYIRHEKNMGLPQGLNTGFANSTGEYLTWTSDDNFYANEAIQKMLSFLQNKKCDFVYCDYYRFNDEDTSDLKKIELPDVLTLSDRNDVGACFLYSREVKEVIGDYDTDSFLAEDYDYWIRISKKFSMQHLAESLYFYRKCERALSLSRFHEVRVVGILVRLKNEVLTVEAAAESFIDLIIRKHTKYRRINKAIAIILFSRKVCKKLRDFKSGKLNFREVKSYLMQYYSKV